LPETNEVKDEVVSKEADSSSTAVQVEDAKPVEAAVKDDANISNVTSSSEAAPTVASNAVAHPEPVAVVMEAPAIPEVAAVKAEPASASEPSPVIHPATSSSDAGKIDESQMADADGKYILNSRAGILYNVKNGSSFITSKGTSENLSNHKHLCFCCLLDKT
jgi:hypothetical protein